MLIAGDKNLREAKEVHHQYTFEINALHLFCMSLCPCVYKHTYTGECAPQYTFENLQAAGGNHFSPFSL